jgi:hypothetical protein
MPVVGLVNNFGHGKKHLSAVLATLNLLAFTFHTVAELTYDLWSAGTFARDAKLLTDAGYRMTAVTPVDQFRYSAHVEIVARLER